MDNPRYINYARINGNTPEKQLQIDKETYKGGCMLGFSQFIQGEIRSFLTANPEYNCCGTLSTQGHIEFDKYLSDKPVNTK